MEANIGQASKDLEAKCRIAFDEILAQVASQKEFLRQVGTGYPNWCCWRCRDGIWIWKRVIPF